MQCWCWKCAGKVVHRTTWVRHGSFSKPQGPLAKRACLAPGFGAVGRPVPVDEVMGAEEHKNEEEEYEEADESPFLPLNPLGMEWPPEHRRLSDSDSDSEDDETESSESEDLYCVDDECEEDGSDEEGHAHILEVSVAIL